MDKKKRLPLHVILTSLKALPCAEYFIKNTLALCNTIGFNCPEMAGTVQQLEFYPPLESQKLAQCPGIGAASWFVVPLLVIQLLHTFANTVALVHYFILGVVIFFKVSVTVPEFNF